MRVHTYACMYDNVYEGSGGCYIKNLNTVAATILGGIISQSGTYGVMVLNTAYVACSQNVSYLGSTQ